MQHRECEAWVECAGARTPVYGLAVDGRKISGWIVSEPGQSFSIHVRDTLSKSDINARFLLDGVLGGSNTSRRLGEVLTRSTFRTSLSTARPYQFAEILSTDDDTIAYPGQTNLAELGSIRVQVYRVVVVHRYNVGRRHCTGDTGQLNQKVLHEKDKKLGGVSVSLGVPQHAPSSFTKTRKRPYDRNDSGMWVEFEFRYRTRGFLQAQGIIAGPAVPRVIDLADDEDVVVAPPQKVVKRETSATTSRNAEIAALKARLQQLEALDVDALDDEPEVKPKVEPYRSPFKRGEVLDLTLDD
ncbi:hypothetical protein EXIGLDRAFT_838169 [Exidia glandulosa HHB12029]|uniref:DUF7918 domain-containing protein n=1 Tax=Exidia glandulosa HHB12029 TaxID=1314781 RepID=A0A165G3E9_EXIGL|nr:hypothetical protein EXIGLDRAFT_838169 [Exidia glandulosa HHB12029]